MTAIDSYKDENGEISRQDIKKIIPYEDPFLLIDKVLLLDKRHIRAEKEVKAEEEFFKGHFVGFPIMPGALIVESMGQAGTLLLRYNLEDHEKKEILAYKFSKAQFFYPTLPGDTLTIDVTLTARNKKGAKMKAEAKVNDRIVTKAKFTLAIVEREWFRKKFSRS